MRTISEKDCLALKGSTEASLALGGGMTSFTHFTRVGVANLSKYASGRDEQFMPIDIAVEADMRAGSPVIVSEMARQLGYRLEPEAGSGRVKPHDLSDADALTLSMEAADAVRVIHEAVASGRLDELSWRRISKEIHELKRAADHVLSAKAREV